MSHWDADRQQWVRGPQTGQAPEEPYEPPVYPPEEPYEPPVYPPPPAYRPTTHDMTHDATRYEPVLGPAFGPPPGLPPGPPPGPPQGWSRATVLTAVVASVVLVAGLGFGGWALLRHHDGNKDARPGSSSPPFDQPSTDSTTNGTTAGTTDPGTPSESTTDAPSYSPSTEGPTPAPSGYVRTTDPAGFSLDVPEGRQRSTEGDSVFYKTADGNSLIQVFALRGPETTPYESLVATEQTVSKNPGYRRIRLVQLGSGAGDAAELEYTYVRTDSTVRHVVVQAFTDPSTVQYALLVAGPDSDWTAHQEVFRNVLSSFCTTGHCPSDSG